jgi:DnaJ-class molecular chaperone
MIRCPKCIGTGVTYAGVFPHTCSTCKGVGYIVEVHSYSPTVIEGKPGKDGYTPIKGIDYFDGLPGRDGVSMNIDSLMPVGSIYTTVEETEPPKLAEGVWEKIGKAEATKDALSKEEPKTVVYTFKRAK